MKPRLTNDLGQILTGRTDSHVIAYKGKHRLTPEALAALLRLQAKAHSDGIELELVSSFRDYERQLRIWNRKARGEVTLLDVHSQPLTYSELSSQQILDAILRWSALPGTSRHHWGTDIDVFDAKMMTVPEVQLVPAEYAPGGPFHDLHRWLDEKITTGEAEGFYRPYMLDRGGTSPESWHLSYAPQAHDYFSKFDLDLYRENIQSSPELALAEVLAERAEETFLRYFKRIDLP